MGKVNSLPDKKLIRDSREKANRTLFEHEVDLKSRTNVNSREAIRNWFHANNILTYPHWGENAQVLWSKDWRKYYFKDQEIAVQFALRFG
jgi:hypothetical protein